LVTSLSHSLQSTRDKKLGNLALSRHEGCGVVRGGNKYVTSHLYMSYYDKE
jgi:hypothetical protein